jgi:hypothetical protein
MDGFIKCNLICDGYGRELVKLPTGNGTYPPLEVDNSFLVRNSDNGHVLMQVFVIETVENMVRVSVPSASLGIDSKIWLPQEFVAVS